MSRAKLLKQTAGPLAPDSLRAVDYNHIITARERGTMAGSIRMSSLFCDGEFSSPRIKFQTPLQQNGVYRLFMQVAFSDPLLDSILH